MSKPEWTKIGMVEVCVGTDGVTGVWTGKVCHAILPGGDYVYRDTKKHFEELHCQPPKPRHTIKHYADGSCVVESTEQDEQGRPLRCVRVFESRRTPGVWEACRWQYGWTSRARAVEQAVQYVETGE